MTFYKRTIFIRKTIYIVEGFVSCSAGVTPRRGRDPSQVPAGVLAADISCTITVDVPVLTDVPERSERYEIVGYLHEHGFGPDDEIGIDAQALPERCPFRKRTGAVVYRRVARTEVDKVLDVAWPESACVLALDDDMRWTIIEGDTPVVVRVRDIFPEYEPAEDK